MDAVAKGQAEKAIHLAKLVPHAEPGELAAWNVLLRKAAEQRGVPFVTLERVFSHFATQLQTPLSADLKDMVRRYCTLAKQADCKRYAPPVRKAMHYIDGNLSNPLSLKLVADATNISSSYLSCLFKKETGQTLTQYIHRQRIAHAMELLEHTNLQVQAVAQHCGFFDVHYFSKLFRRLTGYAPSAYRNSLRQ